MSHKFRALQYIEKIVAKLFLVLFYDIGGTFCSVMLMQHSIMAKILQFFS